MVADQSQPFSSREYCTQVQCQSGLRAAREKKGRREAAAGDDAADGRALEIHLRTAATARAAQRVRRLEALLLLQLALDVSAARPTWASEKRTVMAVAARVWLARVFSARGALLRLACLLVSYTASSHL